MINLDLKIRPALPKDKQHIANLMYFESHVHRHLDWRAPLEWLGSSFYWVIEADSRLLAAFACPQDPEGVAWVRLFAHAVEIEASEAWQIFWDTAREALAKTGGAIASVIVLNDWMLPLLTQSGFQKAQEIIMMTRDTRQAILPEHKKNAFHIRTMLIEDLPAVSRLDSQSFEPIWQNSFSALQRAYPQSAVATVAEDENGLVGYQISTHNPFGAHLARLAVQPTAQGQGIGSALIIDLIQQLHRRNLNRLTVNTQNNNSPSLGLYKKLGFQPTGERFPVYLYQTTSQQ